MRSWQSYLVNGMLRLMSKSQVITMDNLAKHRARIARLDASNRKEDDVHVTQVNANGVTSHWIDIEGGNARPLIYYLHGGGFVFRSPLTHQAMLARWCRQLGGRALMPFYRLAPEDPYPAAPEDCITAYRWLIEDQCIDPRDIIIAGDSAGGCLALATLHNIKQAGLPMPACAVFLSPGADLTMSGESLRANYRRDPMFNLPTIMALRTAYASNEQTAEAQASPLFAEFEGYPPLQFIVGSTEMLLDDSRRCAEKARIAGVETELHIWPGMSHVFPVLPFLPESKIADRQIIDFIARHIGKDSSEQKAPPVTQAQT